MGDRERMDNLNPGDCVYVAGPEGVGPCRELLLYREPSRFRSMEQRKRQYERHRRYLESHYTIFHGRTALAFRHFFGGRTFYMVNGNLPDWDTFHKDPRITWSMCFGSMAPGVYTETAFLASRWLECSCAYGKVSKIRKFERMERMFGS